MTRRRFGLLGLIILMIAVAAWVLLPKHGPASTTDSKAVVAEPKARDVSVQRQTAETKPDGALGLSIWTRPPAKVAARNARRVRFADLKRLGASDQIINRLTDGDSWQSFRN